MLSVSGTEIAARFRADMPVSCADRTGQFEVRLIESNQTATGGGFTLLGNTPTVVDVEPTFVQADTTGNFVDPADITISGADFADTLLVRINQYVMPTSSVEVIDETTIEVTGIPAPNQFGLVFNTSPCITDDGLQGLRKAPTPVDVTVVNLPGNCADTLVGGLIYEPGDNSCVASSTITVDIPPFPDAEVGSCSTAEPGGRQRRRRHPRRLPDEPPGPVLLRRRRDQPDRSRLPGAAVRHRRGDHPLLLPRRRQRRPVQRQPVDPEQLAGQPVHRDAVGERGVPEASV